MGAAFYQAMFGARRKTDLIVGNDSDYGYDLKKIFIYDEIFTPACSPRGVLVRLML
jgi:hypothetical protein